MQTVLGFLVALVVVGWGARWYLLHSPRVWRPDERAEPQGHEPPPLVPREAAEQLMQRPSTEPPGVVEEPLPRPVLTPTARPPSKPPARWGKRAGKVWEAVPQPPALGDGEGTLIVGETRFEKPLPATLPKPEPVAMTTEEPGEEAPPEIPTPQPPSDEAAAAETEATAPEEEATAPSTLIIGFCARCRDKRPVADPIRTRTKKGKPAIRGHCVQCGAGMFVFTSDVG